ncbi:uncharacterized protein LOC118279492 [Spodoptera frugiperda]|uniref:Uncharacterized protein LOC118279492 n=1 Tax=Spodoptera frugiperda TaxID=7108 RepID=A0A9R0DII9_SPOFR|nr:uncharacterized protein LOC118279492 [Spodoptera frugiperda]
MLVLLLILFSSVTADSDENKYVDFLPEDEKLQFIQQVARRILKDVQSQENKTEATSKEIDDEMLKKHNEYVKAILKEESEYVRRRKSEKDKLDKPASDETGNAFDSEKKAVPDDDDAGQVDLTLRNDRRGNANPSDSNDYIKVEIITDEPPIIKRSIQEDAPTKNDESDETSAEVLDRVTSNVTSNIKTENFGDSTVVAPTRTTTETIVDSTTLIPETSTDSKSEHLEEDTNTTDVTETDNKVTEKEETTTVAVTTEDKDHTELAKGRNSGSQETEAEGNISDAEESWSRRSNSEINITEINNTTATTSAIELFGLKSAEKNLDESNNKSSEETTTIDEQDTKTTTEINKVESANNNLTTVKEDGLDKPKMRATNETDTKEEVTTTENTSTTTTVAERTTKPVPVTTEIEKSTTSDPLTTESTNKTTEKKIIVEEFTSPPKKLKKKKVRSKDGKKVINQRALDQSKEFSPQIMEDSGKYIETGTEKNARIKLHKLEKVFLGPKGQKEEEAEAEEEEGDVIEKPNPDKNFIELEKVYYDNNYKVKKGNTYQVYEIGADKTPFIKEELSMVEQPYYVPIYNYSPNNAYFNPENRLGPNPGDASVEKQDVEGDDEAEERPPTLRAKSEKFDDSANSDDSDESDDEEEPSNNNQKPVDMEYNDSDFDDQRKKFGSKQGDTFHLHSIHKQPLFNHKQYISNHDHKKHSYQVNPEDYADNDYYFGLRNYKRRVNQDEHKNFPNSNENDHPAHSIQEGSLKDHVRAVRNILFHQKSFGLLDKDKYGHEGMEDRSNHHKSGLRQLEVGRYKKKHKALRSGEPVPEKQVKHDRDGYKNKKQLTAKKQKQHKVEIENQTILETETKDDDILEKDEHIKKVGYLKSNNGTKELYVIDDYFKKNVQKYIQKNVEDQNVEKERKERKERQNDYNELKPATPLPPPPSPPPPPPPVLPPVLEYVPVPNPEPENITEIHSNELAIEELSGDTHRLSSINSFGNMQSFSAYNANKKHVFKRKEEKKLRGINKYAEDGPQEPLPEIVIPGTDTKAQDDIDPLDNQQEIKSALLKELPGGEDLNINSRRKDGVKLGVYLQVLKDMINTDSNALKQYDWLGSTVDIQSALQKMFDLTGLVTARRKVHPADMELLKYVLFLHKLATEIIQANDFGAQLKKNLVLNRNNKSVLKDKGLINKVWLYLRKKVPDVHEIGAMRKLNKFLMSIEDGLFELHDAVKNVAKITKYKNQHWYDNLKDLYINTEDKNLLELLLHMTVLRVFVLIEEGTKHGLEDNYILYMKKNKKEAKRTLDEIIFVMQILDEYNKLVR